MSKQEKETLTAPQVAKMCGVTSVTVQRWVKAGYFPGAWKGLGKTSPYRIPRDEVEAFIARMTEGLQEQWLEEHGLAEQSDGAPKAAKPAREPRQPDHRATIAALAEMLQQFGGQQAGTSLALIVEDDPDAGDIFEFTLKQAGLATSVVESGDAALKWLAAMVPDVLVLDLHLPDVPGTQVLRHIRDDPRLREIPVIVATAHPEMAEDIQDEADLVLIKPVRYHVLQDKAVELAST